MPHERRTLVHSSTTLLRDRRLMKKTYFLLVGIE
jgi:hypothetical protein